MIEASEKNMQAENVMYLSPDAYIRSADFAWLPDFLPQRSCPSFAVFVFH
jgi:hypothetical protein